MGKFKCMSKLQLGTCIKKFNKEVIFQDDKCVQLCGDLVGKTCFKGCMDSYAPVLGMTLIKGTTVIDECLVDAVVINDGDTLTTLMYINQSSEELRKKEILKLEAYGLSKSELIVFQKVIEGKKNSQISKELFISKATLKTHLNNIYKKLPESYQQYKNRK